MPVRYQKDNFKKREGEVEMQDWKEEYQSKQISARDAAEFVKSGDFVVFTPGREAHACGLALAARKEELRDVKILAPTPTHDLGWYDPGWEESFSVMGSMPTAQWQEALDARRCQLAYGAIIPHWDLPEDKPPDVLFTEISPPDEKGFCSFGQSLWTKRKLVREAKLVIAETNKYLLRTYGDNYVHVSEIDHFVEHVSSGRPRLLGSMAGKYVKEPLPYLKDIAGYVGGLIKDKDTLQIGVGRTTERLVEFGMLENKHDIGFHSEATPPGLIALVRAGVVNGRYKTLYPRKVVVTSIGGSAEEDMKWVEMNPLFLVLDVESVVNPVIIARNDNMVAINAALSIDLTGQINAETVGFRILGGTGGQLAFVVGALLSKGGRSITILESTAAKGTVSRIVPYLDKGSVVNTPRSCADYVVTEYGVASLRGKTLRKRAEELIAIAHPDFRAELKKQAMELY